MLLGQKVFKTSNSFSEAHRRRRMDLSPTFFSAGPGITAGMQTMTLSYAAREQHIRNKECEERAYKDRLIGKLVDHILKKNI